jgi:uncharacterized protein (TIGR04376 family)
MAIFDDISRFLEDRLDEFLKANPHLEIEALLEQLREQERDAIALIQELERQKQQLETEILALAGEIQTWHARVQKANRANRPDLAQSAQERETMLLRQGNQRWGQMEGTKQRLVQAQALLQQIRPKIQEVQAKAQQARQARERNSWETSAWERGNNYRPPKAADPLEREFQRWELDEEIDALKRNL